MLESELGSELTTEEKPTRSKKRPKQNKVDSNAAESDTNTKESDSKIAFIPTIVRVSRSVKLDGKVEETESEQEDVIDVKKFVTTPAICKYGYSIKRSKNYQSVGVDVSVDYPCYAEEVDKGLEAAKNLVIARLKEENPLLEKALNKISNV